MQHQKCLIMTTSYVIAIDKVLILIKTAQRATDPPQILTTNMIVDRFKDYVVHGMDLRLSHLTP